MNRLLADAVLIGHALLAGFIVTMLPAVWLGAARGWRWVRHPTLRGVHLAAIGCVAALSALGIPCPLTVLEDWLRNGSAGAEGCIQRWVDRLLFHALPGWMFTAAYLLFALAVLLTFWRIPPVRRKR
jgi:hypothetical protein